MAQITSYDGTPIVDAIVIGPDGQPGYSQTAKLGEPGFSNVIVDDPLGSMTFETWKDWTVDEDDCTFERLYTGIVYAIRVDRGPYRDGPGRKWYLDIVDMGQLLKQRVISGADGQRPFEMDTVRINWLYNSDYLDGLVFDNGFLNVTDNPQGQFDADHRFEYPMDVFVSVAGPISKHAFVYWDAVAEQPSIFYDRFDVSLGAAGIGFSNVMSDVDETTVFYPKVDAEATYDGEDRYGGLMLGWRGPSVYRTLGTTVTSMGRTRDVTFQTDRIGLASTASSVTSLLLAQHADDLVSIKFSAELPSSVVNLARPGQTLEVRFEHIPGFETTQEVFIRSTISQQIVAGRYLVQYDVAPNPTVPLVPTGGDPGDLPPVEACDIDAVSIVQSEHGALQNMGGGTFEFPDWPNPPTAGNILVAANGGADPGTLTGWTLVQDGADTTFIGLGGAGNSVWMWMKVATASEGTPTLTGASLSGNPNGYLFELAGVDTFGALVADAEDPGGLGFGTPISPAADHISLLLTVGSYSQILSGRLNPDAGVTEVYDEKTLANADPGNPQYWVGYMIVDGTTGGAYDVNGTFTGAFNVAWGAITAEFYCSGSEGSCLEPGQPSGIETVTLTGADGTTRCPFADGSLHVYIDNVEQTATLVSQDGATRMFTLGFDPTPTEVCTVEYLGR